MQFLKLFAGSEFYIVLTWKLTHQKLYFQQVGSLSQCLVSLATL